MRLADGRLRATVAIFGLAAAGVAVAGAVIDPAESGRAVAATEAPLLTVRRTAEARSRTGKFTMNLEHVMLEFHGIHYESTRISYTL